MTAAGSWGVATAVAKYAVDGIGAFTTLFIEVGTASAVLWIAMLRVRPRRTVPLRHYLFLGLLEPVVAYGALDLGLRRTGAADAALLDGLQSVMVLVMGVLFIKEAVNRRSVAGVVVATVGAALLAGAHLTIDAGIGNALVLLGSLGASASVIVVSRLAADASALELTAYQFGFGFLCTIPVMAVVWSTGAEPVPGAAQLPHIAAAMAIGITGFALGYLAYNYAISKVAVGVAGMALNLIPLFGVVVAVLWLGENLSLPKVIGGALILVGIFLFPYDVDADSSPVPETTASVAAAIPKESRM
ncbi:DMT family transporter [Streptomyces angustmyceticus]|uniref:Membrane protein n=1 Tax=Streptomyces angustmyceticus TaxID=285578 RepID=A0A5J4LJ69_9ACTN|nr:DMT family transporter [Streptomyces angustmyceticus]UAL70258.1 DMT family transporter [Streptomyces angustmyceticus]GES34227.1 membrane protein [Streptomyces angustmyceticus]